MFLSLDVEVAEDWWRKEHRSYFVWEFGKPPDLVLEIVSNQEGGEDGEKKRKYAQMRISYYVIYDPLRQVMPDVLTVYRLLSCVMNARRATQFPALHLGLTLWEGTFEGKHETWLRWTDAQGVLVPTGKERAEQEHNGRAGTPTCRAGTNVPSRNASAEQESQRADQERQRAEQEFQRAEQERQRAEHLAELLRRAGVDPEQA